MARVAGNAWITLLAAILLASAPGCRRETPAHAPAKPLDVPGRSAGSLQNGESHSYRLLLKQGDCVALGLEPERAGLWLELAAPDGRALLRLDPLLPQRIPFPSAVSGLYQLRVLAPRGGGGPWDYLVEAQPCGNQESAPRVFAALKNDGRARALLQRGVSDSARVLSLIESLDNDLQLWIDREDDYRQALTQFLLCRLHGSLENIAPAIEHCGRAESLQARLGNRRLQLNLRGWLARLHQQAGELAPEEFYREYKRMAEEALDSNNLWRASFFLAEKLFEEAKLGEALEEAYHALSLAEGHRGARTFFVRTLLVQILSRLGYLEEALSLARQCVDLAQDSRERYSAQIELGWAHYLLDDYQSAERAYSQAQKSLVDSRAGLNAHALYDRLGTLRLAKGQLEEAGMAYRQALEFLQDDRSDPDASRRIAIIKLNLAGLAVSTQEPQRALQLLDDLAEAMGSPNGGYNANVRAAFYRQRAAAFRAVGEDSKAERAIRTALDLLWRVRESNSAPDAKMSFKHLRYERFHHFLVELQAEAGRMEEAFETAQAGRARILNEVILSNRRENVPSSLLEEERRIQRELQAAQNRLRQVGPRSQPVHLHPEVERLLHLLQIARAKIRDQSQAATPGAKPTRRTLKLGEIQSEFLNEETKLLFYSLGEESGWAWVLGPDLFEWARIPGRNRLEKVVDDYRRRLLPRKSLRRRRPHRPKAEELSEALLRPISKFLDAKRLIIVADGTLQSIPFAALPKPGEQGWDGPMVRRHEVVTLPSVSTLALLRGNRGRQAPGRKTIAVLADPVFNLFDERLGSRGAGQGSARGTRAASDNPAAFYPRLEHSAGEAQMAARLVPPGKRLVATGFEARRELVLGGELSGYDIVHFATHAEVHDRQPMLSSVVLTLFDQRGRPLDGRVYAYEISNLELPASLVVLSACETGQGRHFRGEGLVGLTQSFMQAGASRVVASLWKVDDEATTVLMEHFQQNLLESRLPPVEALRQAQLEVASRARWNDPFYWAGFIFQGDWKAF